MCIHTQRHTRIPGDGDDAREDGEAEPDRDAPRDYQQPLLHHQPANPRFGFNFSLNSGSRFRFQFQVSGVRFLVSSCEFRVLGCGSGFRDSGVGVRV